MTVSGGEVLLEVLRAHGVDHIFCSPGTEWVPVWESLVKLYSRGEKTPIYINCRHESLAVSAAGGYAKITGRLPAVLLHASVGPLNGAMSIRAAYHHHIPMLICTGDSSGFGEDEDDSGEGWRWASSLSDVGGPSLLTRPYVKWSGIVTSKENLLGQVYRCCEIAQTTPKGPVLLSIPWEFLVKALPETRIPLPSPPPELSQPNSAILEEVAQHLLQAQNPIILTEHAGASREAVSKLVELAELLSIPVFEYFSPRFANFPKDHPLHAGYNALKALQEADIVFIVGGTTPWQTPSAFPKGGTKVILLDEDTTKDSLPYWWYRIDLKLTGDITQGLITLLGIIRRSLSGAGSPGRQNQERLKRWQAEHEQLWGKWEKEALAGQASKPIDPKWFFYVANRGLPRDAVILYEGSTHQQLITQYMQQAQPNANFRLTGGLGRGLGEAAGMKLAQRGKPVVLFTGDGTFSYNPVIASLGLCQEYHLPILILVLNNRGYATMMHTYKSRYPEGWATRSNVYLGVTITPSPDYAKVAEAFDGYGERVEEPNEIEPALNRAWQQIMAGRLALLDVILEK